ncbi:Protein of unknown function [Gryllus bimaculatus]|nr:Protein of unknown function [Gryllus bimaculatus]
MRPARPPPPKGASEASEMPRVHDYDFSISQWEEDNKLRPAQQNAEETPLEATALEKTQVSTETENAAPRPPPRPVFTWARFSRSDAIGQRAPSRWNDGFVILFNIHKRLCGTFWEFETNGCKHPSRDLYWGFCDKNVDSTKNRNGDVTLYEKYVMSSRHWPYQYTEVRKVKNVTGRWHQFPSHAFKRLSHCELGMTHRLRVKLIQSASFEFKDSETVS